MSDIKNFENLTPQEKEFAELYVYGEGGLAGDAFACYRKVYNCKTKGDMVRAKHLLTRPEIQEYIVFLDCPEDAEPIEARIMRKRITDKLMKIGDSCATMELSNRRGDQINPASLRAVSVNAYKLVAEINGIKKRAAEGGDETGEGGSKGITFNVIVPSSATEVKVEHENE